MKFKTTLIFCFLINFCYAQNENNKSDYNWQLGFGIIVIDDIYTDSVRKFILHFTEDTLITYNDSLALDHIYANSTISSNTGEMIFYSNGCGVSDKNGELIPELDTLTYFPEYFSSWNGQCGGGIGLGLSVFHGAIMLPIDDNQIALLTMVPRHLVDNQEVLRVKEIYLTRFIYDEDGWFEEIIEKDRLIFNSEPDSLLMEGQFASVRHGNGDDWWIISATRNNEFQRFHLSTDTIVRHSDQATESTFAGENGLASSIIFTKDGSKMISFGREIPVKVYDFDRCTGDISNPYFFSVYDDVDTLTLIGGAVSPSGRFFYAIDNPVIYQYDLWSEDIEASRVIAGEWDGFYSSAGSPNLFNQARLGPDDRIYISPISGVTYMHYIEYPDSLGLSCGLRQHALHSPTASISWGLPNYPNFRLGRLEGSVCDTIYNVSAAEEIIKSEYFLELYPNPATSDLLFDYSEESRNWQIVTLTGIAVRSGLTTVGKNKINVSNYPAGVYILKIFGEKGISSEKFVVQK